MWEYEVSIIGCSDNDGGYGFVVVSAREGEVII